MKLELHCAPKTDALDETLADTIGQYLDQAIHLRGEAWLVVSGGRTPLGLFHRLARQPRDWARVNITLADERCVAPDDPLSNTRLVREHLLQGPAAQARFIPLADDAGFDARLPSVFDAVILGMGEDGHTASIFPDSPERDIALASDCAQACLRVSGGNPVPLRLTLSAARLLASRALFFQLTGARKWTLLANALSQPDPALPISHFLHAEHPEKALYWAP